MEARRRAIDPETALRAGEAVVSQLLLTVEYRRCRRVVAYAALGGELPVDSIAEPARKEGKQLLWPRLCPRGDLEFAPCERIEDLAPGRHGTREPPRGAAPEPLGPDVLLLVPGLAFDESGGRLGRGGGAWDRALAALRGPFALGVGYEFQLVEAVPREPHDRPVDALLTERAFRRCRGQ